MYYRNIKELSEENTFFRKVIFTGDYSQVVLMSIPKGEDIGEETHYKTDQILFLIKGKGEAVLNGRASKFQKNDMVYVPAGTKHNIRNKGNGDLKLYTIYSPPLHATNTIHATKEDAEREVKYDRWAYALPDDFYENM